MENASIRWHHHETTKDSHEKHNTCWSLSRQLNSYCIILLSYYDSFEYIFTCTNICILNLVIEFFTIMFTSFLIPQQNCPFHKCIFDKPMAHCNIVVRYHSLALNHWNTLQHFLNYPTAWGRTKSFQVWYFCICWLPNWWCKERPVLEASMHFLESDTSEKTIKKIKSL